VRGVTDTSGHIQFLGWQPSLGEFIVNIIWPLVAGLLLLALGPSRRWLSRTWNVISDRYASLSDSRRIKRIQALESQITTLNEYNDRQIILRILSGISTFIILIGLGIVLGVLVIMEMLNMDNTQTWYFLTGIWDFLDQIFQALLILGHTSPTITPHLAHHTDLFYQQTVYTVSNFGLGLLLILSYFSAMSTLQDLVNFSDPPKAIRRLEGRINKLRAKST
jgi:hypothetical protein